MAHSPVDSPVSDTAVGAITHRRWCRKHNEPYANWEMLYTVVAWAVYLFIILVIYFHFVA